MYARTPPMFPLKNPSALIVLDGIADPHVSRFLVDWLSAGRSPQWGRSKTVIAGQEPRRDWFLCIFVHRRLRRMLIC
jgi:hypothetical protein